MTVHLDFTDGTSAWVDLTDLLPPLSRWTLAIETTPDPTAKYGLRATCFAVDRERAFPKIKLSERCNEDVALASVAISALEKLYPRPDGKRYER